MKPTLQFHTVQFSVVGHEGEDLLFNAGGLYFDPVEDGGLEHVDPGVDLVRHKLLRLLHKVVDFAALLRNISFKIYKLAEFNLL